MSDKKLVGSCLIGQSGGPTAVINASAYGLIEAALQNKAITKVYAAHYGISGVLNDQLMIMDEEDPENLRLMLQTPAAVLGSCRYKMTEPEENDKDYRRLLEIFQKYDIRYFFYNGGNDSMDTCNKISRFMREAGWECRVIGIPKTIDNDLMETDHCPGFASAAKYIATSIMEVARDSQAYEAGMITVIECMGRHAGWLTAASVLASYAGCGPDLIYVPEVDFDIEQFLADVRECCDRKGGCVIAVSEGIHYADGAFVSAAISANDGFGHAQLGGLASRLAEVLKEEIGGKVRGIELSLLQRAAAHCASATDVKEAYEIGRFALESAIAGETGKMAGFRCQRGPAGYQCEYALFDLAAAANTEKLMPREWINEAGNFINAPYIDYCLPLIQGEPEIQRRDSLPRYCTLKQVYAK